jgi:quercetin dioxygenase-like cupin family protein
LIQQALTMTHLVALIVPMLAVSLLHGHARSSSHEGTGERQGGTGGITISLAQKREKTRGPAERFTGTVHVEMLAQPPSPSRVSAASVSFAPGARSAWHTHPLGQTLIVTAGNGWVQEAGGPRRAISAGDVIWTPPGVKHWHGATVSTSMTHIAIQEALEGKNVEWFEKVTDAEFSK